MFSNTETMATVTLKEREWCLKCKMAIYISANLSVDLTQLVGKAGSNELQKQSKYWCIIIIFYNGCWYRFGNRLYIPQ